MMKSKIIDTSIPLSVLAEAEAARLGEEGDEENGSCDKKLNLLKNVVL